jgi:hypothetical protein
MHTSRHHGLNISNFANDNLPRPEAMAKLQWLKWQKLATAGIVANLSIIDFKY